MSCASPGDQMSLTQTLTHFPQNRPGAERADLRALGDFRPQKAWKVLRRSRWRNRPQLITRRSLVQVQPPQPQNHRFPAGKRCFSLPFCNFGGRPHFLDTEVTQTVTHTGKKRARRRCFRLRVLLLLGEILGNLQRCRQDSFHGLGRLLLGRRGDVGIGVQGEPCREVPQHPGHRLDVHPILKCQRSERVPEVVESNSGQPRPLQHPVEHVEHAVR